MNTITNPQKKPSLSTTLLRYLKRVFIEEKMNNLVGLSVLCTFCLLLVVVIAKTGFITGVLLSIVLLGAPVVVISIFNVEFGFLCALFVSFFIFYINRFLGMYELQSGILIELFLVAASIGLLFRKTTKETGVKQFANPISFMVLAFIVYFFIQAFNPNASNLTGWLFMIRGALGFVFVYIVSMNVFTSLESVKLFTKFWFGLALFTALYGIYQEVFGFTDFENKWIYSSEQNFRLTFIWGRFRRMSFLSDSASFGIFMAYTGVAAFILAAGPYSTRKRIFALISGVLMFVSMSYSGTRTAYAAVPVGLGLFMLMSANNRRTVIFSIILTSSLLIIVFGPFHSGTISRIRSTFNSDEDASYNVREDNRHSIQPFMMEHPMGGGIATTGLMGIRFSPHHPLAGFPPDSGMVKTALEMGWIGLLIEYGMFFTVLAMGIIYYFKAQNPTIKNLYLMYLACFFAMTIANYAQVTLGQKPMNLLFYSTFALVVKLNSIDNELTRTKKS